MTEKNIPKEPVTAEEYEVLGISCPYGYSVSERHLETSSLPYPNGKHRWKYRCKNEDGDTTDWKYTSWIYD